MSHSFDLLHDVEPGKHFYQFYKGDEDYYHAMLCYFKAGLENGDFCLWLTSEARGLENAQKAAEEFIPNFLSYSCSGQMQILSAEKWYLKNEKFDEEQALNNAVQYMEKVFASGYKQIRAAGDVMAIPTQERCKLAPYEKKIHELIHGKPVIGLCAYPILECSFQETKMILECHDDVLIGHL